MNLESLHEKIKKNPKIYESDYLKVIQTYSSMMNLPLIPNNINFFQFISLTCHFYSEDISELVITHFEKEKNDEKKKEYFYLLGIIHRKKKLKKQEFLNCLFQCTCKLDLLRTASDLFYDFDLNENMNYSKKINLNMVIEKLQNYLTTGTIQQRKTAAFFIIYIYDKTDYNLNNCIIEMFKNISLQNMVIDYFLGLLILSKKTSDFKTKITKNQKRGKKGFDYTKFRQDQKLLKLEKKYAKEKKRHQKKQSMHDIVNNAIPIIKVVNSEIVSQSLNIHLYENMVKLMEIKKIITEIEKPRELIDFLLKQVRERKDDRIKRLKKLYIISLIKTHFKISVKTNDILLKMIDPSKDDLPLLMYILIRSVEKSEMKSAVLRISQLFCGQKDTDMKCYGLQLLKEVVLIDRNEEILKLVQETAEKLRKEKSKGVFFAYNTLIRAIKYGITDKGSAEYHMKRKKFIFNSNKLSFYNLTFTFIDQFIFFIFSSSEISEDPMDEGLKQEYDRLLNIRKESVPPTGKFEGICNTFCPYFEIIERRLRKDISIFENKQMVKKYVRSAAGRGMALPDDVRPLSVLQNCFDYLMSILEEYVKFNDQQRIQTNQLPIAEDHNSLSRWILEKPSLLDLYKFLEDRTRAIRLDISVQELSCEKTISLIERICNFHIIFNYLLHDHPKFEEHLNVDQIKKILLTLNEMYKMRNSFLLVHDQQRYILFDIIMSMKEEILDKENNFITNRQKILTTSNHGRYESLNEAKRVVTDIRRGNILAFFKYFKKIDFLTRCFMTTQLKFIMKSAIEMFKISFFETISIDLPMKWLHLNDPSIFTASGIKMEDNKLYFRERPFVPKEMHSKLIPNFDFQVPRNIKLAIYLTAQDMHIRDIIFHHYISKWLQKKLKLKKPEKIKIEHVSRKMIDIDQIMLFIYDEYIKRVSAIQLTKIIFSHKRDLIDIWLIKIKQKRNQKKELLVITEKTVSAIMFRQKIKKTVYNPKIIDYDDNLESKNLLQYKYVLFVLSEKYHQAINNQFYMLNKLVITPNIKNLEIEKLIQKSKYVQTKKISELIAGKSKEKSIIIMCELLENKRNINLQDVMVNYMNHNILNDIDVYFTEDEIKL